MLRLLSLSAVIVAVLARRAEPNFILMNAAYTPYNPDGSINLAVIPALAADAVKSGVNTIWIGGGMGQFQTHGLQERLAMQTAWIAACKEYGLFSMVHVGATVQAEAITMARNALANDADSICALPPYYGGTSNIQRLIDWFKPVLEAARDTPFYYYHLPGSTRVNIPMHGFFTQAAPQLPTLAGGKIVTDDFADFLSCVQDPALRRFNFMWAAEPKLTNFAFPGRGTVLAESFYAGTFLRMWDFFNRRDLVSARREQQWKFQVDAVFGRYGGTRAKRAVYFEQYGIEMGPSRAPEDTSVLSPEQYTGLIAELRALNFFNQTLPPWTPPGFYDGKREL